MMNGLMMIAYDYWILMATGLCFMINDRCLMDSADN